MQAFYSRIILVVTVILGAALRLFSPLGGPAIAIRDYWYDEAFTGILLKQSWATMNQMIFADVHPPLYYWLAKIWSLPFGYSPAGIRYFSALMGILSVLSIYWIGKKVFSERAGVLAAVITAFSPFAIEYSQEARMYALFGLLMLWAFYFFYKALQTNTKRDWLLWGVIAGLSFYTHYLSLFFFVMFYTAYVAVQVLEKGWSFKNLARSFFPSFKFWMGIGVVSLFFASWIKIFIAHISKGNLGWIDPAQLSDILSTLQIFFFGHPAGTGGVPWSNEFRMLFNGNSVGLIVFTVLLVLFVKAWLRDIKRKEILVLAILSFGTFVFLIIASQFNIKLYVARYFMPAALYVYLLLAGLIIEVVTRKWAWLTTLGIYVLLLLLLKPMQFSWGRNA